MGLGTIIAFVGGGLWYLNRRKKAKGTGTGGTGTSGGSGVDADYQVVSAWLGGATNADAVPWVLLLHGQASTPEEAIANWPIQRPLRVLAPRGRYPHDGKRSFVDPAITDPAARDAALRDEALRLAQLVDDLSEGKQLGDAKQGPKPVRLVVVGLDVQGGLAAALGLADPLHVRSAFGTGGVVPPAWVPLKLPLLNNLQIPIVRKISYGNSVAQDSQAVALALQRGFNFNQTLLDGPPTLAAWRQWLLDEADPMIETP